VGRLTREQKKPEPYKAVRGVDELEQFSFRSGFSQVLQPHPGTSLSGLSTSRPRAASKGRVPVASHLPTDRGR